MHRALPDRREWLFLVLAGGFLGTVTMMNILGVTRFIDLSFRMPGTDWIVPAPLAVGVLPYPVTFLCTDFLSEFYGRARANAVVWVGLGLNLWLLLILWLGVTLPEITAPGVPSDGVFDRIASLAFGNVVASMAAYLVAQRVDVELFHFWKRLTKGKHLWLRNNGSTLVSQLIDSVLVTSITHFYARALPVDTQEALLPQFVTFVAASYVFKLLSALLDTLPFYVGTLWLFPKLGIRPIDEESPS